MEVLYFIMGFLACASVGVSIILGHPLVASGITIVALIGYLAYRTMFKGDSLQSIAGWVFMFNFMVVAVAFFAREFRGQDS